MFRYAKLVITAGRLDFLGASETMEISVEGILFFTEIEIVCQNHVFVLSKVLAFAERSSVVFVALAEIATRNGDIRDNIVFDIL